MGPELVRHLSSLQFNSSTFNVNTSIAIHVSRKWVQFSSVRSLVRLLRTRLNNCIAFRQSVRAIRLSLSFWEVQNDTRKKIKFRMKSRSFWTVGIQPPNTLFLGPIQIHITNGTSIGSAVLESSQLWPTDRETKHKAADNGTSVTQGRIFRFAQRWGLT